MAVETDHRFITMDHRVQLEYALEVREKLHLSENDPVIVLHVNSLEDVKPLDILVSARECLKAIAEEIALSKVPKYVLGVTYEPLAQASRLFGFSTEPIYIEDTDYFEGMEKAYINSPRYQKKLVVPLLQPFICYMTGDEFIKRFNGKN